MLIAIGAFVGWRVGECPSGASSGSPTGLPGAACPWKLPEADFLENRHDALNYVVIRSSVPVRLIFGKVPGLFTVDDNCAYIIPRVNS